MTIIRESRGPAFERLLERARAEGGEQFADGLAVLIETYRDVIARKWPQWPTPGDARQEARRIMAAAVEVLAAYSEASEAVQVRLRCYLREQGLEAGALDTRGRVFAALSAVHDAAATIYQAQPRTKRGDDVRAGFLHALREHFAAHGVAWSSTADEASEYEITSLAVDAVGVALEVKPAAASKAIQRIDTSVA